MRGLLIISALLLAPPVWAQSGNPAVLAPGSPELAPGQPASFSGNAADRLFMQQAAVGGMAEIELAGLVLSRSHSAEIEAFADRMKVDHGRTNDELKGIAESAGVKLPTMLDAEYQAAHERLEAMSDADFDLAYLQGQLADHQKTALLFIYVIGSGQDPALKNFASKALPVIMEHLRMVQDLQARLAGKAT